MSRERGRDSLSEKHARWYVDAQTMAPIGKATLVVEEQQNWGKQ